MHSTYDCVGLVIQIRQHAKKKRYTYMLIVWMISREELTHRFPKYQLAPGKTHILSNWAQILPARYLQAIPDPHKKSDPETYETSSIFDISRSSKGKLIKFIPHSECEVTAALEQVSAVLLQSSWLTRQGRNA